MNFCGYSVSAHVTSLLEDMNDGYRAIYCKFTESLSAIRLTAIYGNRYLPDATSVLENVSPLFSCLRERICDATAIAGHQISIG